MRILCAFTLLAAFALTAAGCSNKSPIGAPTGPTIDTFTGRVTQDGKPVTLPPDSGIQLKVMQHGTGWQCGIPLQADGTFKIGMMPVGKYSMMVETPAKGGKGPPGGKYAVPDVLYIETGKTDYTIELGKDWKL
jgi:hypothetical protein